MKNMKEYIDSVVNAKFVAFERLIKDLTGNAAYEQRLEAMEQEIAKLKAEIEVLKP